MIVKNTVMKDRPKVRQQLAASEYVSKYYDNSSGIAYQTVFQRVGE